MEWLLLIATLPGQNGSLRLRFWRQMKSLGAANLRDGVYVLPWRQDLQTAVSGVCAELSEAGGNAYVLRQGEPQPEVQREWSGFFDRAEAYGEWRIKLDQLLALLPELAESEARRQLRQLRKELDAVIAIDYLPGEPQQEARRAWEDAQVQLTRHYSPDEPLAAAREIPRLEPGAYRGRRWATRRRPWVDRLASAWLIRRFVDPDARFVWLADIHDCPRDALGFDFDGAAFTHVGEKVTFEVLLASFGLEQDSALMRLAPMVHAMDVGGETSPETVGFEAILAGARSRIDDDDALLTEIRGVFDSLYAHYQASAIEATRET